MPILNGVYFYIFHFVVFIHLVSLIHLFTYLNLVYFQT